MHFSTKKTKTKTKSIGHTHNKHHTVFSNSTASTQHGSKVKPPCDPGVKTNAMHFDWSKLFTGGKTHILTKFEGFKIERSIEDILGVQLINSKMIITRESSGNHHIVSI